MAGKLKVPVKFMGITKRWVINVASIMLVILITLSLLVFFLLRTYYYGAAKMTVEAVTPAELSSVFIRYGASTSGFSNAARDYVESFPQKDTIAVWAVDTNGKVFVSSSGFRIDDDVEMPDRDEALRNSTGCATWTGKLPSGEKVMAYTCTYKYTSGTNAGSVRFMVSLDAIDDQLAKYAVMIAIIATAMLTVLMASGIEFIRSIVNPVSDIGKTAKKIAAGDLKASIEHYPYNDEIGELCATINDMADKLSESDRLKNDFISTVSHELRTPLTAIRGWGETLLEMGSDDPEMTKRGMGVIISEAGRLNDMVEELLDFSRINSGRMKLNMQKIDFLAELDEVVFSFKDRTKRENIDLIYDCPEYSAPATGDASRIKQVFINIIDNAIKYNRPEGKVIIHAEIPNPSVLEITVIDTGVGIKSEDLPHIKEKFYKANNTIRGSGIGLAVVDEIVKLHSGELNIDSVYGQGTTVKLTLPLEPAGKDNNQI